MAVDDVPHIAPCKPGLDGYRGYSCRCNGCKAANAKYSRDRRARLNGVAVPDNVRPIRTRRGKPMDTVVGGDVLNGRAKPGQKRLSKESDPEPGHAERGVIYVCANNSIADERPDLVAQARILARLMDNPEREKEWSTASRQLSSLMAQLCPVAKTKSQGRLVAIKKMTNRRPPEGVSR